MNSLIEFTAQSAVWAFNLRFLQNDHNLDYPLTEQLPGTDLSSVMRTVSRWTVRTPWVTVGAGAVFRARQHDRIRSSFF